MPSHTDCAGSVEDVAGACCEGAVWSARADELKAITAAKGMKAPIKIFIFIPRLFQCSRGPAITRVLDGAAAAELPSSASREPQGLLFANSADCTRCTHPSTRRR